MDSALLHSATVCLNARYMPQPKWNRGGQYKAQTCSRPIHYSSTVPCKHKTRVVQKYIYLKILWINSLQAGQSKWPSQIIFVRVCTDLSNLCSIIDRWMRGVYKVLSSPLYGHCIDYLEEAEATSTKNVNSRFSRSQFSSAPEKSRSLNHAQKKGVHQCALSENMASRMLQWVIDIIPSSIRWYLAFIIPVFIVTFSDIVPKHLCHLYCVHACLCHKYN